MSTTHPQQHLLILACAPQVEDITQAVTPLLKTFFVGILQNPFAYEALQNFTTSPTTQGLLSGLRNATELGLPGLQRLLVRLPSSRLLDLFSKHTHLRHAASLENVTLAPLPYWLTFIFSWLLIEATSSFQPVVRAAPQLRLTRGFGAAGHGQFPGKPHQHLPVRDRPIQPRSDAISALV